MKKLITFEGNLDTRCRQQPAPTVARLVLNRAGQIGYVVIGTDYGYLHTRGGDMRVWGSYSAARRAAKGYQPL